VLETDSTFASNFYMLCRVSKGTVCSFHRRTCNTCGLSVQ